MENKNELLVKYNISEQDLYTLGIIEAKKDSVGFFEKEKLKAKSMGVLKPYNVKFMDLGNLLNVIKTQGYHKDQTLIDKYGNIDLESKTSSLGMKYVIPLLVGIFFVFFYMFNTSSSDTNTETNNNNGCTGNGSQNCITEIRQRFQSTGKDIVGEQYEGDGIFQVQFIEYGKGTYNAYIRTDCDCKIAHINVTPL